MYIIDSFKHPSFKDKKIRTLFNAFKLVIFSLLKIRVKYKVSHKNLSFFFNFIPLGKQSGSGGLFVYREDYEPLLKNCSQLIKEDSIVLDIGANQGIYSMAFANIVGKNGVVIAVEPFPEIIRLLSDNAKINKFDNIIMYENVVSDNLGHIDLNFGEGTVSASITKTFKGKKRIRVQSVTIDEICKNYKRVDFIKLDIEGAELKALLGGDKTLEKFKPILSIEVDESTYDSIDNCLKKYGYKSYIFDENDKLRIINNITKKYSNLIFKI